MAADRIATPPGMVIVGVGLLGGSLGLAMRRTGFDGPIVGVGRRQESLRRAEACGCIDRGVLGLEQAIAGETPAGSLIVLATPVGLFQPILEELASLPAGDRLITDVGSTKRWVCDRAAGLLPDAGRFVGSHPMAGSEQRGPDAAAADLFEGRPCVVTPTASTDADAAAAVESLWQRLGMRVTRMTPDEHDRRVAAVSHVPHAAAAALVHLATRRSTGEDDGGALSQASSGFRDATRLAAGDAAMWRDIFATNGEEVRRALAELRQGLDHFEACLDREDWAGVEAWLDQAARDRAAWLRRRDGEGKRT